MSAHDHTHHHHAHRHAQALRPGASLLRLSAWWRLAGVALVIAALWACVFWALQS